MRWREPFLVDKCSRNTLRQLPSAWEREESLSSRSWWRRSLFCCWWFWPCRWSCRRRSLLADSSPFRRTRWVSAFCSAGQLPTSKLSRGGGAGAGAVVVDVVGIDRFQVVGGNAVFYYPPMPTSNWLCMCCHGERPYLKGVHSNLDVEWDANRIVMETPRAMLTCQYVVDFICPIFFLRSSSMTSRPLRERIRFFPVVHPAGFSFILCIMVIGDGRCMTTVRSFSLSSLSFAFHW